MQQTTDSISKEDAFINDLRKLFGSSIIITTKIVSSGLPYLLEKLLGVEKVK